MNGLTMPLLAKLGVAKPADDLDSLSQFYRDGLGLTVNILVST